MYKGIAILADGTQEEKTGTIVEICEWADKLASESDGDVRISIGRIGAA